MTTIAATEIIQNKLTEIFPTEMDKKDFKQTHFLVLVPNINSEQFAKLNELVLEHNLNINMKRSGGSISIFLT